MKRFSSIFINTILCVFLVVGGSMPVQARPSSQSQQSGTGTYNIYLPLVMNNYPLSTIIPDTTNILDVASSQDLASISADGSIYTFSSITSDLQSLAVGDIMIGDVSSAAPDGFLRQVTAISSIGGQLNVTTSATTIEQAVQQISLQVDQNLTASEVQNASAIKGLHIKPVAGSQGLTFDVPINNVVLYDADGNLNTTNDQVVANGDIGLTPIIHLDLEIQDFHIQSLTFSVTGQESASLTISSEAELSSKAEYDFPPIILGAIPTPIGPIVPELNFYVGVDGGLHAGVSTGIADTTSWTVGVAYAQGAWGNIASEDISFTFTPPVVSVGLAAKGYVGAQLSILVDGVAGPNADIEAYLRLSVDPLTNPWWTLYGGLSGKAGVEIEIFSAVIASYNADLFDYETIIAQAPASLAAISISAGFFHTCALTQAGGIKCWGDNEYGQVGDGTSTERFTPVGVVGLTSGVVAISLDAWHSCALSNEGGVKCWGWNNYGQLGDGTTTNRLMPVDVFGLGSGVIAIEAGVFDTCALTQAGGVKCWGDNRWGQLGDGTTTSRLNPVDVTGLGSGVSAISAGSANTCALTQEGGVKCWGSNIDGELGDGTTTPRLTPVDVIGLGSEVISISAGDAYNCALTQAGGVKCWGYNDEGELGDGTTTTSYSPVDVIGLGKPVIAISASDLNTCALTQAGGVKCWGDNDYGQLGDGTTTERLNPVDVTGLSNGVSAISSKGTHTCALMQAGGVKCWGDNENGDLGDGTTTERPTPVNVIGFP